MNREEIIRAYPIVDYLTKRGVQVTKAGKEFVCRCLFHQPDKNPSMYLSPDKQLYLCRSCGAKGTVIDLEVHFGGGTVGDAMKRLGGVPDVVVTHPQNPPVSSKPAAPEVKPSWRLVNTYPYRDAIGKLRYEVERHEDQNIPPAGEKRKKKFVQFHFDASGSRVSGLADTERLLYRLPEVMESPEVLLVEGEKCVDAVVRLGWCGSCNSGGSSGWLEALADSLRGKTVLVCQDNDDAGDKWAKSVLESLQGKADVVKIVRLPKEWNDIADIVEQKGADEAVRILTKAIANASVLPRGYDVPCETVEAAFQTYADNARIRHKQGGISLACWLPSLSKYTRPLFNGDMVVYLADTGAGKTAAVSNISLAIRRPSVVFQLELSNEQLAERYASAVHKTDRRVIEEAAIAGQTLSFRCAEHILLCKKRRLDVPMIADIVRRSSLLFGSKAEVVYVDYLGLVQGSTGKRYERISGIAEDLKTMACDLGAVLMCTSQLHRVEGDEAVVPKLHSAKDSSSIESSAQLMLGAWRVRDSETELLVKILKNTNGPSGAVINCTFDGPMMRIEERKTRHDISDTDSL